MIRVMIGCPVRDRAWVLPQYLDRLQKLDKSLAEVRYCFIINNCSDASPQILTEFARQVPERVDLIFKDYPDPGGFRRGEYNFSRLAELRNLLLQAFLESDCDYLFSLDSDILVPPYTLTQLLKDKCDVVSALVCNGREIGDLRIYNILARGREGNYRHMVHFPRDQIFPVDCTGAAYLIRRGVIAAGVRYSGKHGAEDIGFCEAATDLGFGLFCDGRVECLHYMNEKLV
jgi:cellulose synthase/poly-beta-1,6-N-acetylglucosamine synthase-like glycosyltransferase